MKSFKGRVLFGGNWKGEAVVSHQGMNTLASFQKAALKKSCKDIIVSDQNNPDLYGKSITGKAICLPKTIGSTTGGMRLFSNQNVCWLMPVAPMRLSSSLTALPAASSR